MIEERELRRALTDRWGLAGAAVARHDGGMNSATWFVSDGDERWVAKAVAPDAARSFAAGLAVAAELTAAGIPAGAPARTRDQELVATVAGVPLALLSWVPGEELAGSDPAEQRLLGATLARVHQALRRAPVEAVDRFHWVDPEADHLAVRPWVRPAVAAAVAALDELNWRALSQGLLHTDPAPEAFRLDRTSGVCGLIDWEVAMAGPLLYDLASAVMYGGGPARADELVAAYLAGGVMPRAEVERGLAVMLRFRWAVQADYFARRIVTADLTGIAGSDENVAGLAAARRPLSDSSAVRRAQ